MLSSGQFGGDEYRRTYEPHEDDAFALHEEDFANPQDMATLAHTLRTIQSKPLGTSAVWGALEQRAGVGRVIRSQKELEARTVARVPEVADIHEWESAANKIDEDSYSAIRKLSNPSIREMVAKKRAIKQADLGEQIMKPQVPGALPHPRTPRER